MILSYLLSLYSSYPIFFTYGFVFSSLYDVFSNSSRVVGVKLCVPA